MKLLSILCEMIPVGVFIIAYCIILFLLLKDDSDMDTQKEKKMIPQYNPMTVYDIGDRFIFNDKVCKALDIIPSGERLVLFDPNTLKGNYIEVAEIVK